MNFSKTFSFYVIRKLLTNLLLFFLAFALISFIVDFLETIREAHGKQILISQIVTIVSYKIPFILQSFLPFIFLFASITTFTKLNNDFEFAAAKSSGISIWSICIPITLTIFILSIFMIVVFQPISAIFLDNNRLLGIKYLDHKSKRVSLQSNGIWLQDQTPEAKDNKIISAQYVINQEKILSDVRIYYSGLRQDYSTNYIAETAAIKDHKLILTNVKKYTPDKEFQTYDYLELPTSLESDQIKENIPHPDIIPFWQIKDFIQKINKAGFSTLKHELYYKSMMATPLLYVSLVLIALSCSLNLPRKGKLGFVFITGGTIGILVFFINKMSGVMALTGTLPLTLAVLAPSISYLLLSIAILIHCEEN